MWDRLELVFIEYSHLICLSCLRGHQQFYSSKALVPKKKRPAGRFSLMLITDLVAIATHDPEEGQEVGKDVVYV